MHARWYGAEFARKVAKPYVHLIFGARQTGKSTLIARELPDDALRIDFTLATERSRFLADPDELVRTCRALPKRDAAHFVFIDEAQAMPPVFDIARHIETVLDENGKPAKRGFVVCRCARPQQLTERVTAIPRHEL